ncbi:DNA repair ATPase [Sphingorhabdus sp. YGSMI21]|uniref:P-loop ATPase, Sll1717 family n=1 Tax=Sphingorhabdus sp. YGSMI21 TaxID=2077182 RepID=UPI000F4E37C4|nr:DNA repair ATPase [Sphingorhabdus sp. YGSMI21]
MKKISTNPSQLRQGMSIGTGNAETDDEFLFDCFVNHGSKFEFEKCSSPRMIIAGRTGSGKTAILRQIYHEAEHAVELDLTEMSMNYVSNSDALRFLNSIGADLDLLFQILWKHVLCIEFIRLRWSVDSVEKSNSIFQKIVDRFGNNPRKAKAIKYLKDWEGRFWITMDENIKEITESFENKFGAEFGLDIEKFSAGGQYDKRMSVDKKKEIVARTKQIIDSNQLQELAQIIDVLAELSDLEGMKSYYLLIDKLDEHWVDAEVRFKMIRALLSSLRQFRKISNLKILAALRTDVRERVMLETTDPTFQREKFDDYALNVTWKKQQLLELVDLRIGQLFKRQYTNDTVKYSTIFPAKMASNKDTFSWMLERTLMRPRDIIHFINECIDMSEGDYDISVRNIKKAEYEYSRKRRDALLQEWYSAQPHLDEMIRLFVDKERRVYKLGAIPTDKIQETAMNIAARPNPQKDLFWDMCKNVFDGEGVSEVEMVSVAASICYRVGAIGLKLSTEEPFVYSHLNEPLIPFDVLSTDTKVKVHPMLHGAYRISVVGE